MSQYKNLQYDKPKKSTYLWWALKAILSFSYWRYLAYSWVFGIVNFYYPRTQVKLGRNVNIHPTVVIRHGERISIGNGSLINHSNVFQAGKKKAEISIGENVHTGPGVMFFAYNHRYELGSPSIEQNYDEADIFVGNDVWIGANSVVLAGATIENGVVIGASTVVRGRLIENGIYAGNPAKLIGTRT